MTNLTIENEELEQELKQMFDNIENIAASVDLYELIVEEKLLTCS